MYVPIILQYMSKYEILESMYIFGLDPSKQSPLSFLCISYIKCGDDSLVEEIIVIIILLLDINSMVFTNNK